MPSSTSNMELVSLTHILAGVGHAGVSIAALLDQSGCRLFFTLEPCYEQRLGLAQLSRLAMQ